MPRKRHRYTRRLGWIKPLERASGGQVGMLYSPRTRRLVRRETTERCPSGRRGRPAKALYGLTPYRGFESLSLRQFYESNRKSDLGGLGIAPAIIQRDADNCGARMAESTAAQALLRVHNVGVRFGGIVALDDVSFDVAPNCIVGLIGPNGAGKTTLFNCLSRLYQCDCGDIVFGGRSLLRVPRHRIAALGIGRTFQNLALFGTMTVLDNVLVGHHSRMRSGFLSNALRLPRVGRDESAATDKAQALIEFLGLKAVAGTRVSDLPIGTQKRVELARALASDPTLLLLDEPASAL